MLELREDVDAIDALCEPRETGGQEARAGADLEHLVARLDL